MKKIRSIFKWFILCLVVYLLGTFLLDIFATHLTITQTHVGTAGLIVIVVALFLYFTVEGK